MNAVKPSFPTSIVGILTTCFGWAGQGSPMQEGFTSIHEYGRGKTRVPEENTAACAQNDTNPNPVRDCASGGIAITPTNLTQQL